MRLLLLSNSTPPGGTYLEHAMGALRAVLDGTRRVVFVPYALADHDGYTGTVGTALAQIGVEVVGAHQGDAGELVNSAEAVFVGGGNTFRLLRTLQDLGLVTLIRQRVSDGAVYIGSSAGTNVASPTIRTTNDMPIVQPATLDSIGLVPFQVNPHYLDPLPGTVYMGETREERLLQFQEENDVPVLALREGTWLARDGRVLTLGGLDAGARLFRRGHDPVEVETGSDLSDLLGTRPRFDVPTGPAT